MHRVLYGSRLLASRRILRLNRPFPAQPIIRDNERPAVITRTFATKSSADEIVEELQELYATAQDEFEIASEETDKKTVYAADDRAAAREELDKFKNAYEAAVNVVDDAETGIEVQKRVGHRLRELEAAVKDMEQRAMEGD